MEKILSKEEIMIGLFFIGIPVTILVFYVLIKARDYD